MSNKLINQAAEVIKNGGLVAFPTETVYGLGADAFNSQAVAQVYLAKGRPGDNPLILHIANTEQFLDLADSPPPYGMALIKACWPGPLTLIVKKKPHLPSWIGGHPDKVTKTIGIRMPSHPVAKAFLQASNCPIAAPSANKSGRPSPTTAAHVIDDFAATGELDMILDGENSDIGIESTVVDITGEYPVILRPGTITAETIWEITSLKPNALTTEDTSHPRSPGMKYRHYAPKAPMQILKGIPHNVAAHILNQCEKHQKQRIGVLVTNSVSSILSGNVPQNVEIMVLGNNNNNIAQNLFAHLRHFDKLNVKIIYAEAVLDTGIGTAIMDRMLKAAEGNILDV